MYAVNVRSHRVRQLTDDKYSEIQANYNSDGTKLVFSTDQRSFTEGRTLGRYTYDIAIMDLSSGEQEILDIWHGADNINPTYDHEDNIYFMSDGDGYRNMSVSYTHLRAHETSLHLVCRLLLEKKK